MHLSDFVFAVEFVFIAVVLFVYMCTAVALCHEEENFKLFALGWLMVLAAFVVLVAFLHAY